MIKTFAEGNQTLAPGDVAHFLWGGAQAGHLTFTEGSSFACVSTLPLVH